MAAQIKAASHVISAGKTKSKALSAGLGTVIRLANMRSGDWKIRNLAAKPGGSHRRSFCRSSRNIQCSIWGHGRVGHVVTTLAVVSKDQGQSHERAVGAGLGTVVVGSPDAIFKPVLSFFLDVC
jgi:hypothetical protein